MLIETHRKNDNNDNTYRALNTTNSRSHPNPNLTLTLTLSLVTHSLLQNPA